MPEELLNRTVKVRIGDSTWERFTIRGQLGGVTKSDSALLSDVVASLEEALEQAKAQLALITCKL